MNLLADMFSLSLGAPWWLLLLLVLCLSALTVFVYRFTVPRVSAVTRWLLTGIRVAALSLLLFLIFEPLFSVSRVFKESPRILIFVDDSRSMSVKESGFSRKNTASDFLSSAPDNLSGLPVSYFTFSGTPKEIQPGTDSLNMNGSTTDFSAIFELIRREQDSVSSIVILSDGVQTAGSNPLASAERLALPVFTIGVGDSTPKKDIYCEKLLTNENLFINTPTTVSAGIVANGFSGSTVSAALYEEDKLIESKQVTLSDGIQDINFSWVPKTAGERKISLSVSPLQGEFTQENNRISRFVKVSGAKLKIAVIAGAPSPDVSFLANSIGTDTNIIVSSFVQIAKNTFIPGMFTQNFLDSSDVLFLLGFPTSVTSPDVLRQIQVAITEKRKPVFITVNSQTDLAGLRQLQADLPLSILRDNGGSFPARPSYPGDNSSHPVLRAAADDEAFWNNLPPLIVPNFEVTVKPEAQLLLKSRINNSLVNLPVLSSRLFGGKRSLLLLGEGMWKWRLRAPGQAAPSFDKFIANSVRWLSAAGERKQFSVRTSKKMYAPGERIEFYGEVYNESYEPVNDVPVSIKVLSAGNNSIVQMSSLGNGLYEGFLQVTGQGEFSWVAEAEVSNKKLPPQSGRFSIGDADPELAIPGPDIGLLKALAASTGGGFFYNSEYKGLFSQLKQAVSRAPGQQTRVTDYPLWADTRLLVLLVLLLAAEWLIRKNSGMQ